MSEDVTNWLEGLGLGKYAGAFAENDIDFRSLPKLTEQDLKELGVSLGHRRVLQDAISTLEKQSCATAPAAESEDRPSARAQPREAERRQLTVMFCDLAGSTELSQQLDPEDLREVNRAYQDACKAAIERYEGFVARYMGDGVLAYFGYPQAHEDDAERAIHAGLGVVESVADLSLTVGDKHEVELGVRVGIATGPVVVGDLIGEGASQESAVVGETPNLAARLQALAARNTVVIGPGTHELAAGQFESDDLGDQVLKGIAEPVHAWRIIAPVTAESRFEAAHRVGLTPLVGREHEIGLLLERWEQAKEGDGQVVLLSGEPGLGKSRLVQALRVRIADEPHILLRYQCSPYHANSAFYPFVEQLQRAAGLTREDTNESKLEKLEALLSRSSNIVKEIAPLFALLLSIPSDTRYAPLNLSPQRQKEKTIEVLMDQLSGLSQTAPVLIVFEDVHWADPTTLEVLNALIEAVSAKSLALVTHRPEFAPPWQ
ncbi:MAG: AAA family ATPase, partial [Gemmatimonadales bacterium]